MSNRWHRVVLAFIVCALVFSARLGHGQATNLDFELGAQKYHQSDWDGAITNFSKSIEAGYDLYNSYSYRAYSKAKKGDAGGAMSDCAQCIKLYPGASGFYWRARIDLLLTNYDFALADFKVGLKLDPRAKPEGLAWDINNAFSPRTYQCLRKDNLSGAISNLDIQVFLIPTNSNAYTLRGQIKLFQGRYGAAIADATTALKIKSENYLALVVRAWARLALKDVNGASEDQRGASAIRDELTTKNKLNPDFWKLDKLLDDVFICLTKNETQVASEKLKLFSETVKEGSDDAPIPKVVEHWQNLIAPIIDKVPPK